MAEYMLMCWRVQRQGIDVNPVTGEVYMCQQRGSPRVSVWDGKTSRGRCCHSAGVCHLLPFILNFGIP